ncbi:MAG TPA: OsmC family protein [Vicinamibacterales bacterium]|nr:OsmC family protein [Acidobacteriota bacterium]HOC17023.1 OsmC family protein [Vicinamibacterales bacterium]
MTVVTTIRNGVDVQRLMTMVEDVKREPWKGHLEFKLRSEWQGGFQARHTPGDYVIGDQKLKHQTSNTVTSDEPPEILGKDAGPSPTDLVLSGLAACLTVGYAANAAAKGIDIQELRLEIDANGDLQGFMNLNDVRPGLSDVSVKVHLKSNAPQEQLQELHDYVTAHSPIRDTISNPVKVRSELVRG